MCPDPYWGPFGGKRNGEVPNNRRAGGLGARAFNEENAEGTTRYEPERYYADDLEQAITCGGSSGKIAGFFAEVIQGVGGTVQLCDGYLPKAHEIVRRYGGYCVADEVQTGFGRLGEDFWGFELQDVTPDVVVMAKSMGNGFPLAAVACTEQIAQAFAGKLHFNTYGGNPLACAVGQAVLDVIEDDCLQENSRVLGEYLLGRFSDLQKKKPELVADVRGLGLMLGVELFDFAENRAASKEVLSVLERCREEGLLLGKGGLYGNVFRIKPPMCWTMDDAKFCADVLERAILEL